MPRIIDVEASGFGPRSYPIEVAWSDPAGAIHRRLIDPSRQAAWTHWSDEAEDLHGITRERLAAEGERPQAVAAQLAAELAGEVVFSDAPDFDRTWLARLFATCDQDLPFRVVDIDDLLLPLLRSEGALIYEAVLALDALKDELEHDRACKHSAGHDVAWLIDLWRRCHAEAAGGGDTQRFRSS